MKGQSIEYNMVSIMPNNFNLNGSMNGLSLDDDEAQSQLTFDPTSLSRSIGKPANITLVLNGNSYTVPFSLFELYKESLFYVAWEGDKASTTIPITIRDRVCVDDKEIIREISKQDCDKIIAKMRVWGIFDHLSVYTNKYLCMGKTPFLLEHQYMHTVKIIRAFDCVRSVIDSSNMGAGKTHVACTVARIRRLKLIVFVHNKRSVAKWMSVAAASGVECVTYTYGLLSCSKKNPVTGLRNKPSVPILTYVDSKGDGYGKNVPTREFLADVARGVLVVFDECQNLRNISATRTVRAITITQAVYRNSRSKVLLISGTIFDKIESAETVTTLMGYIGDYEGAFTQYIQNCEFIAKHMGDNSGNSSTLTSLEEIEAELIDKKRKKRLASGMMIEETNTLEQMEARSHDRKYDSAMASCKELLSEEFSFDIPYTDEDGLELVTSGVDEAGLINAADRMYTDKRRLQITLPKDISMSDVTCSITDSGVMTESSKGDYIYWWNFVNVIGKHLSFRMPFDVTKIPHRISNAVVDLDETDSNLLMTSFNQYDEIMTITQSGRHNSQRAQQAFAVMSSLRVNMETMKVDGMHKLGVKYLANNPTGKIIICLNYVINLTKALKLFKDDEEVDYPCHLIYGQTKERDRTTYINNFQYGDSRVLIINPKTCGVAIDLDAWKEGDERLMFFSPNWNLLMTQQAMGRIMRASTMGKAGIIHVYSREIEMEKKMLAALSKKSEVLIKTFSGKHNVKVSEGFGIVSLENINNFFDDVE